MIAAVFYTEAPGLRSSPSCEFNNPNRRRPQDAFFHVMVRLAQMERELRYSAPVRASKPLGAKGALRGLGVSVLTVYRRCYASSPNVNGLRWQGIKAFRRMDRNINGSRRFERRATEQPIASQFARGQMRLETREV
jgi:hypothetical protein